MAWQPADFDLLVSLSRAQTPPIDPVDVAKILYEESGMNPATNTGSAFGMNGMDADNLTTLGLSQSQWLAMSAGQQLPYIFKLWDSWANSDNNGQFPSSAGMLLALNYLPGAFKNVNAGQNPNAVLAGKNGPYANYYNINTPLQTAGGVTTVNTLQTYIDNAASHWGSSWQNVLTQIQAAELRAGPASTVGTIASTAPDLSNVFALALGGVLIGAAGYYVYASGPVIARAVKRYA
jgi:hypothetical protein